MVLRSLFWSILLATLLPRAVVAVPSAKNKLFLECAIKMRNKGGLETLVGHSQIGDHVLFYGLAGNLYVGDQSLANVCAEDKYFARNSVRVESISSVQCGAEGAAKKMSFAREGGKKETLSLMNRSGEGRVRQQGSACRGQSDTAGIFEIYQYGCVGTDCAGGRPKLLLVRMGGGRTKGQSKKTFLVNDGQIAVQEVLFAEVDRRQLECVQSKCNGRLPPLEATERMRSDKGQREPTAESENTSEPKEREKGQTARESRKRKSDSRANQPQNPEAKVGGPSSGSRCAQSVATARLGDRKRVLYFGKAGDLYVGDGSEGSGCGEGKEKNLVSRAQFKECTADGLSYTALGTGTGAKAAEQQLTLSAKKAGAGRSQCRAYPTAAQEEGAFNIFKCSAELCGGEKLLFLKNTQNRLVRDGRLNVVKVLEMDGGSGVEKCVRAKCKGVAVARVRNVTELGKDTQTSGGPQKQAKRKRSPPKGAPNPRTRGETGGRNSNSNKGNGRKTQRRRGQRQKTDGATGAAPKAKALE